MTTCYYVITNLKGGEDISIPAFDILTTEDLKNELVKLREGDQSDSDVLIEFLKEHVHHNTAQRIIENLHDPVAELDTIVDEANKAIINNFNEHNLWNAIKLFINNSKKNKGAYKTPDRTKVPKNVKELLNALTITSDKIEARLFTGMSSDIMTLADTSLFEQSKNLKNIADQLEDEGLPSLYFNQLRYFLTLAESKLQWKNSNTLTQISNDRLKEGSWVWGNKIVYSDTSDKRHLFMGVFKKLASELTVDQFHEIFKDWDNILDNKTWESYKINSESVKKPEDVQEFFLGSFGENATKNVNISKFDLVFKLFNSRVQKHTKLLNETFSKLALEVSNIIAKDSGVTQNTKDKYASTIIELFGRLYPKLIESSNKADILKDELKLATLSTEFGEKLLTDYVTEIRALYDEKISGGKYDINGLGKKFTPAVVLNPNKEVTSGMSTRTTDNVYKYLMTNLSINKDLIQLPSYNQTNNKWPYWVLTSVYGNKKNSDIKVSGMRINKDGRIEKAYHVFKEGDPITYRKFDSFVNEETRETKIAEKGKNARSLVLYGGITYDLAKTLLSPGDISGNLIIKSIYPGYMIMYDPTNKIERVVHYKATKYDTTEDREKEKRYIVISKKLYDLTSEPTKENAKYLDFLSRESVRSRIISDPNSLNNLSIGDYISKEGWNGFKKIYYSDDTHVWISTQSKTDKNTITLLPINRNEVNEGIVSSFSYTEALEILDLIDIHNKKINRSSTLSSFQNESIAKDGDFIVYTNSDGDIFYGKVIDVANSIALFWNKNNEVWEKFSYSGKENIVFYSDNNRLDASSRYSILANNYNVQMLPTKNHEHMVEMRYVVPKSTDKNISDHHMKTLLPGSAYTQIGRHVESNWVKETDVDRTDDIIKLLGGTPGKHSLYTSNKGAEYERNHKNAGIYRINFAEQLSPEFIKENMLIKGAYVSLYRGESIDYDVYSISNVDDDYVYLRKYFTNNLGEVIFNEIKISKDVISDTSVDSKKRHKINSIARYFLQGGNSNFGLITSEVKKVYNKNKSEVKDSTQNLKSFQKHITKVMKDLGIEVETSKEGFKNGQKAKLVTDITKPQNRINISAKLVINEDLGKREDLVHETMHLLLAAIRFKSPEMYTSMLNSIQEVADMPNTSLLAKEEAFITNIQSQMNSLENGFYDESLDINTLLEGMKEAGIILNPIVVDTNINNLLEILKMPIADFLSLTGKTTTHPMARATLAQITPDFLVWLDKNNFKLEC